MEARKIAFSPPDITEAEIESVAEAMRSGWITTGPRTKLLEQRIAAFCSVGKAVCLNSATACAETALHVLGIGAGDEVITTAYTYTATASVVCHVGAKLVLVDVAPDSYEMDYDQLEAAITERTKAIIPVDIGGVPCDYDRIFEIVRRRQTLFRPGSEIQRKLGRIAVVEDAAHALGAAYKDRPIGSVADFTSFSFHAVKNFTTAEGGALTWSTIPGVDDEEIYRQCMLLTLHGQTKDALAKNQLGAWEYDIVAPYYKCNMTDIMAAIGLVLLDRYPELLEKRRELIALYDERLADLPLTAMRHDAPGRRSSGHLYLIRLAGRDREQANQVITRLAERGVAANVHYKPLPLLTAYKNMGFSITDYPNAYAMFANEVTLPLHTKLSREDVIYVAQMLRESLS